MRRAGTVRQFWAAFSACFSVVVSGSCFGWVTPTLDRLLSPSSEIPMSVSQSSWMVSIIELGNFISPVPASFMADRWGRRSSILLTGPLYFLSWLIILSWPSIETLYLARVIQGLSMGVVFTVVPLYLSEISTPEVRGSITSLFHNSWYLGHLIEYCLGPFLSYRTFTYTTALLPLIFVAVFYTQPESPYFLLMKKREPEANQALKHLRAGLSSESIEEELQSLVTSVNNEMSNKASWRDIVKSSADRRALYIVIGLGFIRILNGLIAIMTYSTQTFAQTHLANTSDKSVFLNLINANNMTIVIGAILFISSFFVTLIVDLTERRKLLMFSSLGASVNLFLAGCYFYLDSMTDVDVSEQNWFPVVAIIVFSLFVTLGLGPVSVMYQSEMFLSNTRGIASSISNVNITINAFFVLKFYQVIAASIGIFLNFWIFSSVCLLGSIWIYFTVPEIKGKSFSQIREQLTVSMTNKCVSNSVCMSSKKDVSDVPL